MKDLYSLSRPSSRQTMPPTAKQVFEGEVFTVYQWQQDMYDGTTATFERLSRRDTVGVLAVTEDKKIIITHQEQPSMQSFISLVGGVVDPGEKPFEAAQRELKEEVGATAENWDLWFSSQLITKIDWAMYMFIAKDCRIDMPQQLDGGEKIKVETVTFDEFIEYTLQPEFRDVEVALRVARIVAQNKLGEFKTLVLGE